MTVTKEDLKSAIANFPIEVVQKMVDYQVEQGNKADPSVFQEDSIANAYRGGFNWDNTEEGFNWWVSIIDEENFDKFFERYPKGFTNKQVIVLKKKGKVELNFNL